MILVVHIIAAVSSMGVATLAFLVPTRTKINSSYILAVFTLLSGTYLVVSTHANVIRACIMGIIYFSIVSVLILVAQKKLATIRIKK